MKIRKKQTGRVWQAGVAFALLLLSCGCTKKDELILLSEEAAETEEEQTFVRKDAGTDAPSEEENRDITDGESRETGQSSEAGSVQDDAGKAGDGVIYVHVCGAVASPGVYELEAGSRVYEAVLQAGGFAEQADQNYVNQAQALEDGVKLVIPTREEAAAARERETAFVSEKETDSAEKEIGIVGGTSPGGQDRDAAGTSDGRININTASEAQLCEIPGVGVTRAAAIAAYRESHGAFEKPEDIMNVNGIKEGMYEKIKDSISVN